MVGFDPRWAAPVRQKLGHLYYEWERDIHYTDAELRKIHRQFYHPLSDRFLFIMKGAEDLAANQEALQSLEQTAETSYVWQRQFY